LETLINYLDRLDCSVPVEYLTNKASFYENEFYVDERVLIPRSATEILIDVILKDYSMSNRNDVRILELGTGSGILICTLLKKISKATGIGIDISSDGLDVTKINSERLGVNDRLVLIQSDWLKSLDNSLRFDYIVSNPPYLTKNEMTNLSKS